MSKNRIMELTRAEKEQIKKVCDLTKYYFMEKYLLSLTDFSENLIYTMVNDMDKFYTDSNAAVLNKSYIEAIKKRGIADEKKLENARLILDRSCFESFAKTLNLELAMMAETGQDVYISSDSKRLFSDLGHMGFSNSILDRNLKMHGIPNYSSILDCCRIEIGRDEDDVLRACATRVLFPVEKEDETTEDVSDLIHKHLNSKSTTAFIEIPLEDCYGKYFEKENEGM